MNKFLTSMLLLLTVTFMGMTVGACSDDDDENEKEIRVTLKTKEVEKFLPKGYFLVEFEADPSIKTFKFSDFEIVNLYLNTQSDLDHATEVPSFRLAYVLYDENKKALKVHFDLNGVESAEGAFKVLYKGKELGQTFVAKMHRAHVYSAPLHFEVPDMNSDFTFPYGELFSKFVISEDPDHAVTYFYIMSEDGTYHEATEEGEFPHFEYLNFNGKIVTAHNFINASFRHSYIFAVRFIFSNGDDAGNKEEWMEFKFAVKESVN